MIISEELLHQVIEALIMYRLRERGEEINEQGLAVLCQLQTDYDGLKVDTIIKELSYLRTQEVQK